MFLALAYMRHHAARSLIMIAAIALILIVPFATQQVLRSAEAQLTARAEATPLMVGSRGSALDLMMNGLYFSDDRPEPVSRAASERIWDSDLAVAIPLYVNYKAGGQPVVGTTLDYFDFRGLEVEQGRPLAVLGEAVLGATAARRLDLGPGDTLISDPENLFDLAGSYPLEMQVVGVLAPTGTADDKAVFVDINTAWVIEGLGHGHDDVIAADAVVGQEGANLTTFAGLTQFTRITPENIDTFHFHGPPEDYPLSAVIAVPWDARASTVLRGRYLEPEEKTQIVVPELVVQGLLATLFRIGRVLDAVFLIVGAAALIAVALAFYLSLRLRRDEMDTAFRLGSHRLMISRLLGAELAVTFALAALLAVAVLAALAPYIDDLSIWLITQEG